MLGEVITLNEDNFTRSIESSIPTLVDFWAAWCGPCKMVSPVVDEIAKEFQNELVVAKLNVDEKPEVARKYGVMNIPTLIIFKNGVEVERIVGYQNKEDLSATVKKVIGA